MMTSFVKSFPKSKGNLFWTWHSQDKMRQYRLSEGRIKRVIRHPQRIEEGIAPKTIAVMQRNDTRKRKEEIWVMYQMAKKLKVRSQKLKVIAAWRYPGVSPIREAPPIPEDILEQLSS